MAGEEIRTILGENVKTYRNRRNWAQADLADYANISINFLGDIERGKKWPHPETLSKLAEALNIKVFELFLAEESTHDPEAQLIMSRFIKDVSLTINKSLSLSVNQSIEYIRKQYKLKKP